MKIFSSPVFPIIVSLLVILLRKPFLLFLGRILAPTTKPLKYRSYIYFKYERIVLGLLLGGLFALIDYIYHGLAIAKYIQGSEKLLLALLVCSGLLLGLSWQLNSSKRAHMLAVAGYMFLVLQIVFLFGFIAVPKDETIYLLMNIELGHYYYWASIFGSFFAWTYLIKSYGQKPNMKLYYTTILSGLLLMVLLFLHK